MLVKAKCPSIVTLINKYARNKYIFTLGEGGVRFVNFHPVGGGGGGLLHSCKAVLFTLLTALETITITDLCQQLPEDAESNFGYI